MDTRHEDACGANNNQIYNKALQHILYADSARCTWLHHIGCNDISVKLHRNETAHHSATVQKNTIQSSCIIRHSSSNLIKSSFVVSSRNTENTG